MATRSQESYTYSTINTGFLFWQETHFKAKIDSFFTICRNSNFAFLLKNIEVGYYSITAEILNTAKTAQPSKKLKGAIFI